MFRIPRRITVYSAIVRRPPQDAYPLRFQRQCHRKRRLKLETCQFHHETAETKRLRALEEENRQLKRVVADQALNIQVLKDVLGKEW
jgi:hypothetical protein